jgi:hypothetical protein
MDFGSERLQKPGVLLAMLHTDSAMVFYTSPSSFESQWGAPQTSRVLLHARELGRRRRRHHGPF